MHPYINDAHPLVRPKSLSQHSLASAARVTRLSAFVLLALSLLPALTAAGPEEDYSRGEAAYQRENLLTAIEFLKSAAEAGHAKAQSLLGYIYDVAEENELALQYYRMSADQGDVDGAYGLGKLYATGEGVKKDMTLAVHWYQVAADGNHLQAIDVLATAYLNGGLGLSRDTQKAAELLERAAAQGHQASVKRLSELQSAMD